MTSERFRLAAALPPEAGWHLELVLDASVAPPSPVVLARVPSAVTGDALALTALMRQVERAARVAHPALLPVRGLADAGGLAVVTAWREGEPLRALVAAAGPLAPPLAARVLLQTAEALQAAHAAGVVHGGVGTERVLVCDDGAVLLAGLGRCAGRGASAADDLQGLARLASDCLGAAPGGPPSALAEAAGRGGTATEVVEALRGCGVEPSTAADLAAALEAALPADVAPRSARRLALTMARKAIAVVASSAERPALSPPPLPSGPRPVPASRPDAPRPATPPERPAPPPASAAAGPRSAGEPAGPGAPPPPAPATAAMAAGGAGGLGAPGLPLLVGAALAAVGLVVGYLLGR